MSGIAIHPTPNPDSLKFTLPRGQFISSGLISASTPEEAGESDLAARLLAVPGIANVFILPEFATLTKHTMASWDEILPAATLVLANYASVATGGKGPE